ncbi:MAG: helix-turn-helix transcriptional regulator [Lachnospiraceae bacterium]|nr:helix-turn-helix transcriptional regulator [Lachnospiraceae bacterium]
MNIGDKIRGLLEENRMTQKDLANVLHISASTLNGYINKGKEPDYELLVRLATYFETSTDYLLGVSNIRSASNQPLSSAEGELIGIYRLLPRHDQQLVCESAKMYYRFSRDSS